MEDFRASGWIGEIQVAELDVALQLFGLRLLSHSGGAPDEMRGFFAPLRMTSS